MGEKRVERKEEKKEEKKGEVEAFRKSLIKLASRKLGSIRPETEKKILETKDVVLLENILENIFDLESEKALLNALEG